MKLFTFSLSAMLWLGSTLASAVDSRPNIVVFYTDDHGHADLSCQGVLDDIKTPNVDALARNGVLARHGYSTAPQCVPSRAGLMIGKFQSRFGVESNGKSMVGFDRELTIAERLQKVGYVTGQFGKWHLGPGPKITEHGFKHVFNQNSGRPFAANITLEGEDREMSNLAPAMYHVDGCSQAAASLIERYKDDPFFLYIAYRAPHVPLDATKKYLDRFPGEMPERRRQALAMLSAVDDGVGLITDTLAKHDLTKKTLIFYIGDNGAPLKIHKLDAPGGGPGWDGSLNDPLNGEKGMLSEGGMHVPFVISWPGTIPAGQVYDHPISALDVAATAAEIAELNTEPEDLDGVNLIPYLTGELRSAPHEILTWRWLGQSAIREGKWKLLRGGDREYLFDLDADIEEKHNIAASHPEIATRLRGKLSDWSNELDPPGLDAGGMSKAANDYFDFYLDGKPATRTRAKPAQATNPAAGDRPRAPAADLTGLPWQIRNGRLQRTTDGVPVIQGDAGKKQTVFLARNGLNLIAPVTARIVLKATDQGEVTLAWRTVKDKGFTPGNQVSIAVENPGDWQTIETQIQGGSKIIHLRVQVPDGITSIKSIALKPARGKTVTLTD